MSFRTNQTLLFVKSAISLVYHKLSRVDHCHELPDGFCKMNRKPRYFRSASSQKVQNRFSLHQGAIKPTWFIKKTCGLHFFLEYLPVMIISFRCVHTSDMYSLSNSRFMSHPWFILLYFITLHVWFGPIPYGCTGMLVFHSRFVCNLLSVNSICLGNCVNHNSWHFVGL